MTVHTAWLAYERVLLARVDGVHPAHETHMLFTYIIAQARQHTGIAVLLDHTRLTDAPDYTALVGAALDWPPIPLVVVYAHHPLLRYRVAATFNLLEIPVGRAGTVAAAYAQLGCADPTLPPALEPENCIWLTRVRGATVTDLDAPPDEPHA